MSLLSSLISQASGTLPRSRAGSIGLLQFVRWRKPRWLPKAPSKIFRVREPTPIDPEEYRMLKTRFSHYRTAVRAIRNFLHDEAEAKMKIETTTPEEEERLAKQEWEWMVAQNDQWNSETAIAREARQSMEEVQLKDLQERIVKRDEEEQLQMMMEAEEEILKEKEKAGSFITPDNLDIEIEKVLNTRKNYDFAITERGEKIMTDEDPEKESESSKG